MKDLLIALIIAVAAITPATQTQGFVLEEFQLENADSIQDFCHKEYNGILPFLRYVNKVTELWIFNTNTEQASRLETNNKPKYNIDFNGRFIVWSQKDMPNGQPQPSLRGDLAYYDLETNTYSEFGVYPGMAKEFHLEGNYVVWLDLISPGTYDFRYHNLLTNESGIILQVINDKSREIREKIVGDKVYYLDNRDSVRKLYCFDLATKTESLVIDRPIGIHYIEKIGNYIVWAEYDRDKKLTTFCKFNLDNGEFESEILNYYIHYILSTDDNKLIKVYSIGNEVLMTEFVCENGVLSSGFPFKCNPRFIFFFHENSNHYISYSYFDTNCTSVRPEMYAINKSTKTEYVMPFGNWINYLMYVSNRHLFVRFREGNRAFIKLYRIK